MRHRPRDEGQRQAALKAILVGDPWHRRVLGALALTAPFAWVTGGFVRNSIWDVYLGNGEIRHTGDVDVVYFDHPEHASEQLVESQLKARMPATDWSVRDQRRMHIRSGDEPYGSLSEAICAFPDTASAIAVRDRGDVGIEILAPFGLGDAFEGVVRPTPKGTDGRFLQSMERRSEAWKAHWPSLKFLEGTSADQP